MLVINKQISLFLRSSAALSALSPLVDVVHAVLEESEVWLVPGMEPPHLITGQLRHVFLISVSVSEGFWTRP